MRKPMIVVAAFAAMLGSLVDAGAQTYPARPITMIVPLAAGGSTDIIGRIMAEGMRSALGQTIVVENVTGAGGTIGVGRLARATPDGYTIGIGQWGTNVANGAIYPLQFDLMKDFEPVALIATQPFLIVSRKTLPADNLTGLIAWLKANADKVSQGNSGVGTPSHVSGILFQNCDIIRAHGGMAFSINHRDQARIHDVQFTDIRVEADVENENFGIVMLDSGPGTVSDITLRNIAWTARHDILLQGQGDSGVKFENCTVANRPLAHVKVLDGAQAPTISP